MIFHVAKRHIVVVHPLQARLDALREIEHRAIAKCLASDVSYVDICDALARVEPLVLGTPLKGVPMRK